jgi:hypothetical protein
MQLTITTRDTQSTTNSISTIVDTAIARHSVETAAKRFFDRFSRLDLVG